eukprot:364905-Chlamydomonas_euryale.AAC.7
MLSQLGGGTAEAAAQAARLKTEPERGSCATICKNPRHRYITSVPHAALQALRPWLSGARANRRQLQDACHPGRLAGGGGRGVQAVR